MKAKLNKKDLKELNTFLLSGKSKNEVAKIYGYCDSCALKKGLSRLNYKIVQTIKKID
jgi:hypothetical protein